MIFLKKNTSIILELMHGYSHCILRGLESRMIKLPISDIFNSFAFLKHTNQSWQSFPLNLEAASCTSQHTTLGNHYYSTQVSNGSEIYFCICRLELQTHGNGYFSKTFSERPSECKSNSLLSNMDSIHGLLKFWEYSSIIFMGT